MLVAGPVQAAAAIRQRGLADVGVAPFFGAAAVLRR